MAKKNSKKETTEEVVEEKAPEKVAASEDTPEASEEETTEEVVTEEDQEPYKLKLDKGVEPFEKKIRDTVYVGFEFGGEVRYVPSQHCSYDKKEHCIVIPVAIFDSLKFKIEK